MENKVIFSKIVALLLFLIFSFYLPIQTFASNLSLKKKSYINSTTPGNYKYIPGEIVVKFKDEVAEKQVSLINYKYKTSTVYTSPYAGFKVIKIPPGKKVIEMVELYRKNPLVDYAEPNYIVRAYWIPDDPYYRCQWHLQQINMPSAWEINQGGDPDIIVAVLDTGVAYEDYGPYIKAPDLAGTHFVAGYDFVNDDPHPNDDNGHGTHVTGTIAQTTNNNKGTAGIAFNCSIMPVKVLDSNGEGTISQLAEGIYYAVDNGAKVINLSLGSSEHSETVYNAVKYAYEHNVVIVAAAGNDSSPSVSYPAAYDECIAVGAVGYDKTLAWYSNYGTGLELVAPGGDTFVDQNNDGFPDGVLQQTFLNNDPTNFPDLPVALRGTSMAAPHVTGVVALMISSGIEGVENIRNILHLTAEDLGDPGYDSTYGYGLIDAAAALELISPPTNSPSSDKLALTKVYSYPNPTYEGVVNIHFRLSVDANITIKIYTISGELVKTLVDDKFHPAGEYTKVWYCNNQEGEKVASGIYIFLLKAENSSNKVTKTGKIAVIN